MPQKSTNKGLKPYPPISDEEDDSTAYWSEIQGLLLRAFRKGEIRVMELNKKERVVISIVLASDGQVDILI